MQLDFMVVFENLAGLFLLIAAGAVSVRLKLIPPEASAHFSALLMKITVPCTLFISLTTKEYDPSFLGDSLMILVTGLILYPLLQLLSTLCARLLRVPKGKSGIWVFGCTYSNVGFMGYPVCLALFGPEGLALSVIFTIAFNLYTYSLGALTIASDSGTAIEKPPLRKVFLTAINGAMLLSLIFYFGQIPVPGIIVTPITYLSNVTTPLSMFIVGMALGNSRGRSLLTDRDAWTCTIFRLLLCPVLVLFLLKAVPYGNPLILPVITVTMAMPVAGAAAFLSETYHGNLDMAAKISFLSNLLSLVTIPLICLLL